LKLRLHQHSNGEDEYRAEGLKKGVVGGDREQE
jgi:hypothetical protein